MLQNIKDFIWQNSRIVLYGTGQDAEALISYLPKNLVEKLEYCDQNAYIKDYKFMGKSVMTPVQLSVMESDVAILVSSTGYRHSIYDALVKLGVQCRKIYFNLLGFNGRINIEK